MSSLLSPRGFCCSVLRKVFPQRPTLLVPSRLSVFLQISPLFPQIYSFLVILFKSQIIPPFSAYSFFDLGYFEKGDTIDVTMIFPNNREISFNKPNVYTLDKYAYDKVINRLKEKAVTSKTAGNKVFLNYDSQKRTSLIVTLPFDRGWIAEINGKKIQVKKFQNGLIKLNVPKGKHQIILKFIPYGFKLGCIISLLGLLLFVAYLKIDRKKNKTHC